MKAPVLRMTAKLKMIIEQAEQSAAEYLNHEGTLLLSLIEVDRAKAYQCFWLLASHPLLHKRTRAE